VIDEFVEAYLAGETPNPCVKCNQHNQVHAAPRARRAIGADVLVTGHYAQILGRRPRARPRSEQGSVVLPVLPMPGDELGAVRFPLGGFTKDEVRATRSASRSRTP